MEINNNIFIYTKQKMTRLNENWIAFGKSLICVFCKTEGFHSNATQNNNENTQIENYWNRYSVNDPVFRRFSPGSRRYYENHKEIKTIAFLLRRVDNNFYQKLRLK